ncbi:MAG TPA: hypothetical protein PKY10_03935 [Lentisphaeria bacterium]|nr:hypothetical protein [Lentisphaeria bacterium]
MKKRVFTLVELLIVIGIIIILSGVLLPVLVGAGKKADQTKAKAEITTLVNAIKQFESTYGVLPVPATYTEGDAISATAYEDLILMLQGETLLNSSFGASNANPNTRKIRFLDVVGNTPGEYLDPWDQNYNVIFDSNYNGEIPAVPDGISLPTGITTLRFSIVVWSSGPDATSSPTANHKSNRDNVYSFSTSWSKASGHSIER